MDKASAKSNTLLLTIFHNVALELPVLVGNVRQHPLLEVGGKFKGRLQGGSLEGLQDMGDGLHKFLMAVAMILEIGIIGGLHQLFLRGKMSLRILNRLPQGF